MNDISIGAVGAAAIAGLVSLLGLIIAKEQKVSEFRQAWINDLRECVIVYLVSINAICDILRLKNSGKDLDDASLIENYKSLNQASHGIALRINNFEEPSKLLLESMKKFEDLSGRNSDFTVEKIKELELNFINSAKNLLRFEWNRVKSGERIFVITKRVIFFIIIVMIFIMIYLAVYNTHPSINIDKEILDFRVMPAIT